MIIIWLYFLLCGLLLLCKLISTKILVRFGQLLSKLNGLPQPVYREEIAHLSLFPLHLSPYIQNRTIAVIFVLGSQVIAKQSKVAHSFRSFYKGSK